MDFTTTSKTVLFFTCSEYGQAQGALAIAYQLAQDGFEVHIGSFPELRTRLDQFQEPMLPADRRIRFHPIDGISMRKYFSFAEMAHPPGLSTAVRSYSMAAKAIACWDLAEYISIFKICVEIIRNTNPDCIVVDSLFSMGVDAAESLGLKCVVLNPLSLQHICSTLQPKAAMLWKYPALCSLFPYPIPWHLILPNIYLQIRLILTFIFTPRLKALTDYRAAHGIHGTIPTLEPYNPKRPTICHSHPALDYPLAYIPPEVISCGPITIPANPVSATDPGLAKWLRARPTVLVNLGSHVASKGQDAHELAIGVRIVLERNQNLQVLWKLKTADKEPGEGNGPRSILAAEVANDRVRIMPWLTTEPVAILATGDVVCSVHHCGANSFNEALSAGVPQLGLPVWLDTYDFATKIVYLGVGLIGNESSAPHASSLEFSRALDRVLATREFAGRAREVARVCEGAGGRRAAAGLIGRLCRGGGAV